MPAPIFKHQSVSNLGVNQIVTIQSQSIRIDPASVGGSQQTARCFQARRQTGNFQKNAIDLSLSAARASVQIAAIHRRYVKHKVNG